MSIKVKNVRKTIKCETFQYENIFTDIIVDNDLKICVVIKEGSVTKLFSKSILRKKNDLYEFI